MNDLTAQTTASPRSARWPRAENITEILDLIRNRRAGLCSPSTPPSSPPSPQAPGKAFGVVAEEIKNLSSHARITSDIASSAKVQKWPERNPMGEMIDRIRRSADEVSAPHHGTHGPSEEARATAEVPGAAPIVKADT